eukprot:362044-Chlamydomonas_euryale.AAC.13
MAGVVSVWGVRTSPVTPQPQFCGRRRNLRLRRSAGGGRAQQRRATSAPIAHRRAVRRRSNAGCEEHGGSDIVASAA